MRVAMVCIDSKAGEYARYINGRRHIRAQLTERDKPLTAEEIEDFRLGMDLVNPKPPEAA